MKKLHFKMKITTYSSCFIIIQLVFVVLTKSAAAVYYVNNNGNDDSPGTSKNAPWATITRVNHAALLPGDSVLFMSGQTFLGTIKGMGGNATNPIIYSSYGGVGGVATINAGTGDGFIANKSNGITICILNFTSNNWIANKGDGIHISDSSNVVIQQCDISQFNSNGIELTGSKRGCDKITVAKCIVHDCGYSGIQIDGKYDDSGRGTTYSNNGINIEWNDVYNIYGIPEGGIHTGNGIVVWDIQNATIERCVVHDTGINNKNDSGPCGIWCFQASNIIFKYNEVYRNMTGCGSDGDGLDFDGGTMNSIMEYNYSHDNYGAGILNYEYSGARPWRNNVIRYNICQNNSTNTSFYGEFLSGGGPISQAQIYSNTFYTGVSKVSACVNLGNLDSSSGFRNNLVITANGIPLLGTVSSSAIQGNAYWSSGSREKIDGYNSLTAFRSATGSESLEGRPTGIEVNPMVKAAGTGPTFGNARLLNTLTAYQLLNGSPILSTGLNLSFKFHISPGTVDYYGVPISASGLYSIGASNEVYRSKTDSD